MVECDTSADGHEKALKSKQLDTSKDQDAGFKHRYAAEGLGISDVTWGKILQGERQRVKFEQEKFDWYRYRNIKANGSKTTGKKDASGLPLIDISLRCMSFPLPRSSGKVKALLQLGHLGRQE